MIKAKINLFDSHLRCQRLFVFLSVPLVPLDTTIGSLSDIHQQQHFLLIPIGTPLVSRERPI